ncbi:MAG: 2-phosphosulfolactate phosphatase [Candidatus Kapabacteria bacterium]|nr:2-phosphosulfolactate phosphatase [Candidatus Kapabacteria bacterium]
MKINTFLSSSLLYNEDYLLDKTVVIIDVLRASTTICTALYNGANQVIARDTIESAKIEHSKNNVLQNFLGGERKGIKPIGFDAGNSPLEYTADKIKNKNIILATTNGSVVIEKCYKAKDTIIAAFVNFNAICKYLENCSNDIVFICAGSDGNVNAEDSLLAGKIILDINKDSQYLLDDSSIIVKEFANNIEFDKIKEYILNFTHVKYLESIGLKDDIDYCLNLNSINIVPKLKNGVITI